MTRKMLIVLVALAFVCGSLMLASCAKKQVGGQEAAKPAPAPAAKPAPAAPAAPPAPAPAPAKPDDKLPGEIRAFEAEFIYFDYDKSELKPEAQAVLKKKAEWLKANAAFKVKVEGHCDERGTQEYNLALGDRRAKAAEKFLNALGIAANRMTTVSYGEEKPADPGHDEKAWGKNRRDEFKLSK